MNPTQGQLIQIRFNSGIFFDAIVETWSDQKSVLRLPETNEVVIIQRTLQDVLLVKILQPAAPTMPIQQEHEPGEEPQAVPIYHSHETRELQDEFDWLADEPTTHHTLKRMSELKDELNKIDRAEMLGKMNNFKPNARKAVNYGNPGSLQVSGIAQRTEQKAPSPSSGFGAELQGLFGQRNQDT